MDEQKIIGIKTVKNGKQIEKLYFSVSLNDSVKQLLERLSVDCSNHINVYIGNDENYDRREMHKIPMEVQLSDVIQSADTILKYILIDIEEDCGVQSPTEESINAFSMLMQVRPANVLPSRDRFQVKGLNDLWNWIIDDFLAPRDAKFKSCETEQMNSFMKDLHSVLW